MTRDELVRLLLEVPPDMEVAVTTDPQRETLEAGAVHVESDDAGTYAVIVGIESLEGVFGPRPTT